jgi:hypothetical protein
MKITRTSITSGVTRTLDLPLTQEELDAYYNDGALIQHAFPNLTASQREFIMTGMIDTEWEAIMGDGCPNDD